MGFDFNTEKPSVGFLLNTQFEKLIFLKFHHVCDLTNKNLPSLIELSVIITLKLS
jgi:hypothetical protein